MHNLNSDVHKPSSILRKLESDDHTTQKEVFEHHDRLTRVLTLQSKGYSQSEIARQLNVNQSTISRDIAEIKKKARSSLDLYVKEEIPNEFQFYIIGLNQIIKNLWELIEDKQNSKISIKDRTYVLSLLMQCYSRRIEMLIGGPGDKMNAKKHMDHIHINEKFPPPF